MSNDKLEPGQRVASKVEGGYVLGMFKAGKAYGDDGKVRPVDLTTMSVGNAMQFQHIFPREALLIGPWHDLITSNTACPNFDATFLHCLWYWGCWSTGYQLRKPQFIVTNRLPLSLVGRCTVERNGNTLIEIARSEIHTYESLTTSLLHELGHQQQFTHNHSSEEHGPEYLDIAKHIEHTTGLKIPLDIDGASFNQSPSAKQAGHIMYYLVLKHGNRYTAGYTDDRKEFEAAVSQIHRSKDHPPQEVLTYSSRDISMVDLMQPIDPHNPFHLYEISPKLANLIASRNLHGTSHAKHSSR